MATMEQQIEAACASRQIPGAVLLATDRSGKFQYSKAFGSLSLEPNTPPSPLLTSSPMWIASCTKLMTTIAALQCVERNLLSLDADIAALLPELATDPILTGFAADGQATLTPAKNGITLRLLLTHSAGLAYDLFNPTMQRWRRSRGEGIAPGATVRERFLTPLLYEPGTSWEYSPGIDFAGQLVARASGLPLQQFMEQNIWGPLGISEMTFFVHRRADLKARMPAMSFRDGAGAGTGTGQAVWRAPEVKPEAQEAMGGGGVTASPTEYLKVLHAILKNDGTLLRRETVDEMFKPHLGAESLQAMNKVLSVPELNLMMGGMPMGSRRDWGLGGLLLLEDLEGWRRKDTLTWGGMPNLTWWIDREAGLCGLYASQILPPGDAKSVELSILFEKAMYERYSRAKAQL